MAATGTGCFVAAIVAGLLLGVGPRQLAKIFWHTLTRMKLAIIAISFVLGLGFTTRYSGLDAVLGLANALFGSLQRITADQLKLDSVLMCAAYVFPGAVPHGLTIVK